MDYLSIKSTKQSFALHINDQTCCYGMSFESPKCVKMRLWPRFPPDFVEGTDNNLPYP